MPVTITLPDGNALELPDGATGADAAAAIGPGLARAALAIEVSHPEAGETPEVRDLARPLPDGAHVQIITSRSGQPALDVIRHDAAHVLATAVLELYEGVKISIGPSIEDGFYYDFEFPAGTAVSEADLPAIEARMREHVKAAEEFVREDVPVTQARERFAKEGQDYKVELIDDLLSAAPSEQPLKTVSLYTNGPFTDLCRGPHAPTTKTVGAFKLNSLAGAYWRGDSDRTMLTRIYGTAFFSKSELAGAPRAPRAGPPARPPPPRARARAVHVLRAVAGQPVLEAGRDGAVERAHRPVAQREPQPRIHGGAHPDPLRRRAVQAVGPLGHLPRAHVLHRRGGAPDGAQADELPGPHPDLQGQPPLLPRPADPLLRGRPRASSRAERHPARADARATHNPGRRTHLLHRRAGPGGGRPVPALRLLPVRAVRLRAAPGALHPARETDRQRRDVGPRRGGARGSARRPRAWSTN